MNTYQKSLIEEHAGLIVRIDALHNYIYSKESNKDDKVEFANKSIQLSAMKKYAECLEARMANVDIIFEDGNYFNRVSKVTKVIFTQMPEKGSDYDEDIEDKEYKGNTESKPNE